MNSFLKESGEKVKDKDGYANEIVRFKEWMCVHNKIYRVIEVFGCFITFHGFRILESSLLGSKHFKFDFYLYNELY